MAGEGVAEGVVVTTDVASGASVAWTWCMATYGMTDTPMTATMLATTRARPPRLPAVRAWCKPMVSLSSFVLPACRAVRPSSRRPLQSQQLRHRSTFGCGPRNNGRRSAVTHHAHPRRPTYCARFGHHRAEGPRSLQSAGPSRSALRTGSVRHWAPGGLPASKRCAAPPSRCTPSPLPTIRQRSPTLVTVRAAHWRDLPIAHAHIGSRVRPTARDNRYSPSRRRCRRSPCRAR